MSHEIYGSFPRAIEGSGDLLPTLVLLDLSQRESGLCPKSRLSLLSLGEEECGLSGPGLLHHFPVSILTITTTPLPLLSKPNHLASLVGHHPFLERILQLLRPE